MSGSVLAYHVIFGTYGSWLPNDPRGSGSVEVRAENLQPFGPATANQTGHSTAHAPHDRAARRAAKQALTYPEVWFNDAQMLSIAKGYGAMTAKSGYVIHACAILTQHTHLVIARHHYSIEQVVRLLRQAGTTQLLADGLHPFADRRSANGRLPSAWAQDFWKVFLYTPEEILQKIAYVERNPIEAGLPPQRWDFVTPYVPTLV